MQSPTMLNSGWFEEGWTEYLAPNLVAEAAKDFGVTDDRARLAIARAALVDGRKVGRWEESASIAAAACQLNGAELRARAESKEIKDRAQRTTAEFHDLKVTQRPTFLLENNIGDRAVFSGLATAEPLSAALDAMLHDALGYASYAAHHGKVPAA